MNLTDGRPLRVLLTVPCYWPAVAYGGPVEKVPRLAAALDGLGGRVTVLTSTILDLDRQLSDHTIRRRVGPADVVYLHAPLRYRWNPVCPDALPWARANVPRFDVVHVLGFRDSIGPAAAFAARRAGIPIVFEPLGMFRPVWRSLRKKWLFDRTIGRRLTGWASAVVAASSRERRDLVEGGVEPDRIVVRPNGVRYRGPLPSRGAFRTPLGVPAAAPLVLYLGRISRQKGLPLLVEAAAHIPGAHIVLAGPDDADGAREEVVFAARRSGIFDRVHLVGPLASDRVPQALADADAFVLPSSGDSFGNAAAEAVVAGVPAVITDRCGAAEFVGPAAIVVTYSADALGEGLRRALFDEGERRRMAEARPAVAEALRWEHVGAAQMAVYRRVLAERADPAAATRRPAGDRLRALEGRARELAGPAARSLRPAFRAYRSVLARGASHGLTATLNGTDTFRFDARTLDLPLGSFEPDAYEPFLSLVARGGVVIDVGAHIGLYAMPAARRAGREGRVVAFEPNPEARARLIRHLAWNGLQGIVRVEASAVGDVDGPVTLHLAAGPSSTAARLPDAVHGGSDRSVVVPCVTLDRFCGEARLRPTAVKIDVEGDEAAVVRGMRGIMRDARPVVLCEVHPRWLERSGESASGLLEEVRAAGYEVRDPSGAPVEAIERHGRLLFLPVERVTGGRG